MKKSRIINALVWVTIWGAVSIGTAVEWGGTGNTTGIVVEVIFYGACLTGAWAAIDSKFNN